MHSPLASADGRSPLNIPELTNLQRAKGNSEATPGLGVGIITSDFADLNAILTLQVKENFLRHRDKKIAHNVHENSPNKAGIWNERVGTRACQGHVNQEQAVHVVAKAKGADGAEIPAGLAQGTAAPVDNLKAQRCKEIQLVRSGAMAEAANPGLQLVFHGATACGR